MRVLMCVYKYLLLFFLLPLLLCAFGPECFFALACPRTHTINDQLTFDPFS